MRQPKEDMATRDIRVLAVATATAPDRDWAEPQQSYDYTLTGLAGLVDPVRASVPVAIAECRRAGVRVVMITRDYRCCSGPGGRRPTTA